MTQRLDAAVRPTFLQGPADALVAAVRATIAEVPQWVAVFGQSIDAYKRMDYSLRELPALRIYSDRQRKTGESWFLDGELALDVILPASLRREDLQKVQDVLVAALVQQFRRPSFLSELRLLVPGLNEIGKTFDVDKALGFEWDQDVVPLAQIVANYRVDLREWDRWMEEDCRTKDEPFERTLGELTRIVSVIDVLRDSNSIELTLGLDQTPSDPS